MSSSASDMRIVGGVNVPSPQSSSSSSHRLSTTRVLQSSTGRVVCEVYSTVAPSDPCCASSSSFSNATSARPLPHWLSPRFRTHGPRRQRTDSAAGARAGHAPCVMRHRHRRTHGAPPWWRRSQWGMHLERQVEVGPAAPPMASPVTSPMRSYRQCARSILLEESEFL